MRNSVKITRKYQFGSMLLHHIIAVFVAIVFESIACLYFLDKPVARYIVAAVFTVVYGFMIYSHARRLAEFDAKSYTPLQPELKWGVLWGVMIAATVLVWIVIFRLNWIWFSVDGAMTNLASIIVNILFYFWTAPYFCLISDTGGHIPVFAGVLMVAVPVAASSLGYMAGMKHFDLAAKLYWLTVEKKEDE